MIRFEAIFRFVFESKQKHCFQLNVSMLLSQCKRSVFFWRMEKENEITTNEFAVFNTKSHSNCTAELMTFATLFGTLTLCQSEKMNWQEPCRCFENVVSSLNLCVHIHARGPRSRASVDNLPFSTLHSLVYSYKTGMVFIFSF